MRKATIMGGHLVLTAGLLLLVPGCEPLTSYSKNCKGWSTRTSYRQVCKSHSGTHCSFWGSEPYQETYCTAWKSKAELAYEEELKSPTIGDHVESSASTLPSETFILRAGESSGTNDVGTQSEGEAFLRTQLQPFLCNVLRDDDTVKALASMGKYKRKRGDYNPIEYSTELFHGTTNSYGSGKNKSLGIWVMPQEGWPFTENEVNSWLSSIGLDVLWDGNTAFSGVTYHRDGNPASPHSYNFCITATRSWKPGTISNRIYVSSPTGMKAIKVLCND